MSPVRFSSQPAETMKSSTISSHFRHLARRFAISAALASNAIAADIKHGSLIVTAPVSTPNLTFSPDTTAGISLPDGSNRGDYWFDLADTNPHVLLSSVTENGRDSNYATSTAYPSSTIAQRYFISVHQAVLPVPSTSRVEDDINVALAFFPLDEFLGGFASNGNTNGVALTGLDASTGINLGTQLIDHTDGIYTLDLTDPSLDGSSNDGILLVNAAANREKYALSKAHPTNGKFSIYVHDNFVNDFAYEQDQFSFVYIPVDHDSDQITAIGRINSDAQKIVSAGTFTVTNPTTGTWNLTIPNETNTSGTLIISPEGGDTRNLDNILSYQWDAAGHWAIESRDLTGLGLQTPADQPAFSFAFIKTINQIGYVDATATGNNDGRSWTDAYTKLQDALNSPRPLEQILVAEGTYYPDEGGGHSNNDRTATFTLQPALGLEGGYPSGGGPRDIGDHPTILSGDIDQNDTASSGSATNSQHVVTASTGVTSATILSGFTITAGNSDNPAEGGGGLSGFNTSLTIDACAFRGNRASGSGGAVKTLGGAPSYTNCVFIGNFSSATGGAISTGSSSSTISHCSFQGNSSSNSLGGAIYLDDTSTAEFINSIIWNNSAATDSSTPTASFHNERDGAVTFTHCLIENWTAAGLNNPDSLDGITDSDNNGTKNNDPRFVLELDPANAPSTSGNLRLGANSPAVGVGNISQLPASITTDFTGAARITAIGVDLGAYESLDQLGAHITNVRSTEPAGTPDSQSNWVPEFSAPGYVFDITPLTSTGNISFTESPAARTSGTLTFTLSQLSRGIAFFQVIIRDSNNLLSSSQPYQFSISTPGLTWHVDQSASGQQNGATWTDAFTTIEQALFTAFDNDEIWVAEGTYIPAHSNGFTIQKNIELYGGFPPGGSASFFNRNRNPASNNTTLSGDRDQDGDSTWPDPDNSDHVIYLPADVETTIDGFTITRGNADGNSLNRGGGGIRSQQAQPTLQNLIIAQNHAASQGGGLYTTGVDFLNFRDLIFENNTSGQHGGGLFTTSDIINHTNLIFRNNHATSDGGGSYSNFGRSTYTNCLYHGNSAGRDGGGIYNSRDAMSFNNYINCTITNNTATENYGGIQGNNDEDQLINSIVWGNTASNNPDTLATDFFQSITNHIGGSDPQFVSPTTDDYHLIDGSPAINTGTSSQNQESTDLASRPRIQDGQIDLGAYEGAIATFALLHPTLDPQADDNGNGMSNYGDYAAGHHPSATTPAPEIQLTPQFQITYTQRAIAQDVDSRIQKSSTLQPGSWSYLQRGEYTQDSDTVIDGKRIINLTLLFDEDEGVVKRMFYRQVFSVPEP